MGAERYEYVEGTSNKFWEIELSGTKYTARWGRIGGTGVNSNAKSFATPAAAKQAVAKLVAEKLRKGYAKVGTKGAVAAPATRGKPAAKTARGNAELEAVLAENRDDKGSWQIYADWLLESGEPWGEMIVKACGGKNPKAKLAEVEQALVGALDNASLVWKYGVVDTISLMPEAWPETKDEDLEYVRTLERILRHPAGRVVRRIELGLPPRASGANHWHFEEQLAAIAAAGPLPLLAELDMSADAEHMDQQSWRAIGDISKLWKAAPRLRVLRMMGSRGSHGGKPIKLGTVEAPQLERLEYISSGLDRSVLTDLAKASLPALTHLDLYFGRDDYGNTCTMKDLAKLLDSKGMPALTYLGLRNSEWEADFIATIAKSSLLRQVRQLSLSEGVLHREGPEALVAHAESFAHLDRLDLSDNYIDRATAKTIRKVLPRADTSGQREPDEYGDEVYRFCAIGE